MKSDRNLSINEELDLAATGIASRPAGAYTENRLTPEQRIVSNSYQVSNNYPAPMTPDNYVEKVLGFNNTVIPYYKYSALYERDPIAYRLCTGLPDSCWNPRPVLREIDNSTLNPRSPFEQQIARIIRKLRFFDCLQRADVLLQIGQYSVIYISYNDGAPRMSRDRQDELMRTWTPKDFKDNTSKLSSTDYMAWSRTTQTREYAIGNSLDKVNWEKLKGKAEDAVNYVIPYSQPNAWISGFVYPVSSPAFALGSFYNLCSNGSVFGDNLAENQSIVFGATNPVTMNVVDASRVMHIVETNLETNLYQTPALSPVFNDLINYLLVSNAAAEIYRRNAGGILVGNRSGGSDVPAWSNKDRQEVLEQLVAISNFSKSAIAVENMDVKGVNWAQHSPAEIIGVLKERIMAAKGENLREFFGSEQGHRASSQDENKQRKRIRRRQIGFCEPLVRQFVDNLINKEIISKPSSGDYEVYFQDLDQQDRPEESKMFHDTVTALAQIASSQNGSVDQYLPALFQKTFEILGIPPDESDNKTDHPDIFPDPTKNTDDQAELFGDELD